MVFVCAAFIPCKRYAHRVRKKTKKICSYPLLVSFPMRTLYLFLRILLFEKRRLVVSLKRRATYLLKENKKIRDTKSVVSYLLCEPFIFSFAYFLRTLPSSVLCEGKKKASHTSLVPSKPSFEGKEKGFA